MVGLSTSGGMRYNGINSNHPLLCNLIMNITIINNCNQIYRPDPIKITNNILKRIPDKFLTGLGEIIFLDESNDPIAKYIYRNKGLGPKFEIYMGGFSKNNSFSIFHYNIVFINLVVDHVLKFLQPKTNDNDILLVRKSRIPKYNWMWLGFWQPIIYLFWSMNYLYSRVTFLRKFLDHRINILLRNIEKNS